VEANACDCVDVSGNSLWLSADFDNRILVCLSNAYIDAEHSWASIDRDRLSLYRYVVTIINT
jgi:hypothetical protein